VLVEPAKESDYRNGGNSSGGLNDETVRESAKDEPKNSVKEAVTFDDLVKSIDSSHAKMTSISENAPVGDTGNSVLESPVVPVRAVDSISGVTGSDSGSALPEKSVTSQVGPIDLAVKKNGDKVHPLSDGTEHVKDSETAESSENQVLSFALLVKSNY
ncbi:MAG: hypothetical protein Q8877_03520, partial [Sweet potato little leaf phytoplasma]|nr:hypothetical protein [Sweet potato little leaf phytoplasma]